MNALFKKPNLLYLIFVRNCYNLKYWLRPWHRNKLLKAITIKMIKPHEEVWYVKSYNKLIKHREDGPAVIYPDGSHVWYKDGKIHREGFSCTMGFSCTKTPQGCPAIETNDTQQWYKHGKFHREDGPAIIWPDRQEWYINDELHREDGPAVIWADGYQEWWINGKQIKKQKN